MFIQIGKDESVRTMDIVGVFDMETATVRNDTRAFLKQMQSEMKIVSLCDAYSGEEPKSFVLCDGEYSSSAYLTHLSSETIGRRASRAGSGSAAYHPKKGSFR